MLLLPVFGQVVNDLGLLDTAQLAIACILLVPATVTGLVVHEATHALVARLVGLHVHTISIGRGPVLASRDGPRTTWLLRRWPVRGWVGWGHRGDPRPSRAAYVAALMAPTVTFAMVLGLALTREVTTPASTVAQVVVLMAAANDILGSCLVAGDWDRTRGILRAKDPNVAAHDTETARLWTHPDRRARLEDEVARRPTTGTRWLLALSCLIDDDDANALALLATLVDDPAITPDEQIPIQAITALTILANTDGRDPRADLLAETVHHQAPRELHAACAHALSRRRQGDPQALDHLLADLPVRTIKRALHPTWTKALLDGHRGPSEHVIA